MENLIENNKLIAEFMGILYGIKKNGVVKESTKVRIHEFANLENTEGLHIDYTKFHTSWDWLMPVVEKIESGEYAIIHTTYHGKNHVYIRAEHERSFKYIDFWWGDMNAKNICKDRKEATYKAVIEFIKWYNENIN